MLVGIAADVVAASLNLELSYVNIVMFFAGLLTKALRTFRSHLALFELGGHSSKLDSCLSVNLESCFLFLHMLNARYKVCVEDLELVSLPDRGGVSCKSKAHYFYW